MNNQNTHYHEKVKNIPVDLLRSEVRTEIRYLCIDCGQSVKDNDPEFDYLSERILNQLRNFYQNWELMYFDQALKNGMLDEYDKGQKITVKRLLLWLSCYEKTLKNAVFAKNEESKEFSEFDLARFAKNGERFPQILIFRIQHKPAFDDFTLEEIEKMDQFQNWKKGRKIGEVSNIDQNFRKS